MSLRKTIAEAATVLKEEKGLSYSQMCSIMDCTNKQVDAIMNGKKGVSMDFIDRFFKEVFDVRLEVVVGLQLNKN